LLGDKGHESERTKRSEQGRVERERVGSETDSVQSEISKGNWAAWEYGHAQEDKARDRSGKDPVESRGNLTVDG
jgi:hypothetical protein